MKDIKRVKFPQLKTEKKKCNSSVVSKVFLSLSRNIDGFPFPHKLSKEETYHIDQIVKDALMSLSDYSWKNMGSSKDLSKNEILSLQKQGFIPKDIQKFSSLWFDKKKKIQVFVNGNDHILIRAMGHGKEVKNLWERTRSLEILLDALIPFAFHFSWGYLTSSPQELGTGLKIYSWVHLWAVNRSTETASQVVMALREMGVNITDVTNGGFILISNKSTLGNAEEDIVNWFSDVLSSIEKTESKLRSEIISKSSVVRKTIDDSIAYLLHTAWLSEEEARYHLSNIRLGVAEKMFSSPKIEIIDETIFSIDDVSIEMETRMSENTELSIDEVRANTVRRNLWSSLHINFDISGGENDPRIHS